MGDITQKFCYKCGALEEEKGVLIDGLCADCFLELNPLIKVPESLEMIVCTSCGAYNIHSSWIDLERDPSNEYIEAAKKLVLSELEVLQVDSVGTRYVDFDESEGIDVGLNAHYSSPETITVNLEVRGKLVDSQKEPLLDKAEVLVKLNKKTCDVCGKQAAGYYEAILQIRGESDLSEEKLSEIFERLNRDVFEARNWSRDYFVSKVKKKHGGLDLYSSSTELARELARYLNKEYGAKVSESAELIGQTSDGRESYRVTIVARLPF